MDERSTGIGDFPYILELQTRWMDNDPYGHVNNVVYYSFFDTLINRFLIDEGGLDIHEDPVIGVCAESNCRFLASLSYPEPLKAGLRVDHLGGRSVRYGLGLFKTEDDAIAAEGSFVHVFVDRATMRPVAMPAKIRNALERLVPEG